MDNIFAVIIMTIIFNLIGWKIGTSFGNSIGGAMYGAMNRRKMKYDKEHSAEALMKEIDKLAK